MIIAQGELDRARVAAFDSIRDDVAALLPEDRQSVILYAGPAAFRDPRNRIVPKSARAFRLAELVSGWLNLFP
jgi:hypothetical protein